METDTVLRHRGHRDLWLVLALALMTYALSLAFEFHEHYVAWLARYERWQLDELPASLAVLSVGLTWYALRRRREAFEALHLHTRAEARANALLAHNRDLTQRLITLQEDERRTLARELHDELGQGCAALRIETALIRHCAPGDRAGMLDAAQRADAAALSLYQRVHDLLRRLRPAHLDTLGLVAALRELCEDWQLRSGVACRLAASGALDRLDDALDVAVYRIVQEALTNVTRHARARNVRIALARSAPGTLRLEIDDDGIGMDPACATRGLGLLGAHERAAALGGALQVDSAPGAGTRLRLVLPVSEPVPQHMPEPAVEACGA